MKYFCIGAALKNSKGNENDNGSPDYEFNIENAPIEHAEKSRKTSLRGEGKNLLGKVGVMFYIPF